MIDIPILAKDALREGDTQKEYRFIVYQTDGETVDFTIDNDTLVYESVKFDERMCSDTNLKFGLCEGTSLEFQAFNIPNITGRRINANVLVYYDYSVSGELENNVDITVQYTGNYRLYNDSYNTGFNIVITSVGGGVRFISVPADASQTTTEYYIDLVEGEQVHISNSDYPLRYEAGGAISTTIPMGWFTVSETSRQASTGILKITAYNKLQSTYLDQNISNEFLALVSQGEDGQQGISIYKLLEDLLSDYAIERYNKVSAELTGSYNYTVSANSLMLYTSEGMARRIYLNVKFGRMLFYIDPQSADYYEYCMYEYSVALKVAIQDMVRNMYSSLYGETYIMAYRDGAEAVVSLETAVNELLDMQYEVSYGIGENPMFGKIGGSDSYILQFKDENYDTDTHLPARVSCWFMIPYAMSIDSTISTTASVADFQAFLNEISYGAIGSLMHVYKLEVPEIAKLQITVQQAESLASSNITLREIQSAVYETTCEFGQLDRETDMFTGITLNHNRLFPAETLYPANTLYPTSTGGDGQSERANKSMYSKLWADEGNIRKFRNLNITYKCTETDPNSGNVSEVEMIYTEVVNADGTDDYNSTNNWLFKNLVWQEEDIAAYASDMASKMRDVTWFPFEMWCAGLPYVETGDEVEINMGEDTYISYVLRRTLKGIQNLQDEMINGTLDIF